MELRSLRYFVAVATQLNFSRAAESLFVSQSNLSEQIAALEEELGTALFVRSNRTISLTLAGSILLDGAQELINEERLLAERVRNAGETSLQENKLVICLEEPVAGNDEVCQRLIEVMHLFKKRFYPFQIKICHEEKPVIGGRLNEKNADIYFCVRSSPNWSSKFSGRVLSKDRFVLTASRLLLDEAGTCDPLQLLSKYPLLMLEQEGHGILEISKLLNDIGSHPTISFCKNNTTISLQLAAGEGISIVPEKKRQNADMAYIDLPSGEYTPSVYLYAIYSSSNRNRLVPLFLDEIEARL